MAVKSDIVSNLSQKLKLPLDLAEKCVDSFFDTLTRGLADGKRVELRGFGTFTSKQYSSYIGRNPKTGEAVNVAPKVVPRYKMGAELKRNLNGD